MYLDIEKIDGIENPDDLVKELKKWDELDTSRYTQLHDEWERNVLFYLGKQWLEKKKGVSGYEIYEDEDEHFRPVTNYIKRNCELKRSQILGRKVHSIIRPNSDNKDDYDSSRLGYLALKAKHIRTRFLGCRAKHNRGANPADSFFYFLFGHALFPVGTNGTVLLALLSSTSGKLSPNALRSILLASGSESSSCAASSASSKLESLW